MLRLIVEQRYRLAWLAIALCAVGFLLYENSKVELLPRTHQRRFAVVFSHGYPPDAAELVKADEIIRLEAAKAAPLREVRSEVSPERFVSSLAFENTEENIESRLAGSISKSLSDAGIAAQARVSAISPESFSVIDLVIETKAEDSDQPMHPGFMRQMELALTRLPEVSFLEIEGGGSREFSLVPKAGFERERVSNPRELAHSLDQSSDVARSRPFGTLILGKPLTPEGLVHAPLRGAAVAGASTLGEGMHVRVENSARRTIVLNDGSPAVLARIYKTREASEIEVSRAVHGVVDTLEKSYDGIRIRVLSDAANYIEAAQENVMNNLQWAIILTCLCILFIARNMRYTLIVSISIPLSLFLSFPIFYMLGISRNVMSLAGITLSVGVVVDATISVINSMEEWIARGFSPKESAIRAARENVTPVLLTSLTTLAVFVPILFLSGTVGDLFRDLSATVIVSQVVSFCVAIFLVPGLTSMIYDKLRAWGALRVATEEMNGESVWTKFFTRALRAAAASRLTTWTTSLVLLLAVVWSISLLPASEFLPKRVTHDLRVSVRLETFDIPERRRELARRFDDALAKLGATRRLLVAASDELVSNAVLSGREVQLSVIEKAIREALPGRRVLAAFQNPLDPESARGKDIDFLVPVSSPGLDSFRNGLPSVGGIRHVRWSNDDVMQRNMIPSHDPSLLALPAPPGGAFHLFHILFEPIPVGVMMSRAGRDDGAGVSPILFRSPLSQHPVTGASLPSSPSVFSARMENLPAKRVIINGVEMLRAEIQTHGRTSSEISADVERLARGYGVPLTWGEGHRENIRSLRDLAFMLMVASGIISLILYAQNRSLGMTVITLFTFVWGLIGAIPALAIHGETMNASALVGFILLVGTIVNNGILLSQIIDKSRRAQASPLASCLSAVRQRTVPVLVTALTTAIGMIPMAFDVGEGSQMYRALSIVVVYGTIVSTPLSLVGIPCLVLIACDAREYAGKLWLRTAISIRNRRAAPRRVGHE